MEIATVPRTASEALKKMCKCEHIAAHQELKVYWGPDQPLSGHIDDRNPCQVCGWFHDNWFSPVKFKGCCGRVSEKKRNGLKLYCMRRGSICYYHKALHRKRNPWA